MNTSTKTPAEINWITPTRGGHGGGRSLGSETYAFLLGMYGCGRGKDAPVQRQGSITVAEKVRKELRWQIGDRVRVGVSANGQDLYLRRIPTGGYALSASGSRKRNEVAGKSAKANIKSARLQFPFDSATIGFGDFIVMDDGTVMFSLPRAAGKLSAAA